MTAAARSRHVARAVTRRAVRGSMAVPMLIMMVGLLGMLGLVEVGYLFWAKREAQKVADLAALAGAQQLQTCPAGNDDNAAARGSAADNHFGGSLAIACGYWDPANGGEQHFAGADAAHPANAVRVRASMPLVPFFGFASFSGVSATSVAAHTDPVAAFSVGSQLLELQDSGMVPGILKLLGLDAGGTALVGYNGLANLHVTPAELLKELGIDVSAATDVGTLNSLLAARQVSIDDLLDAMIRLGEQQQLAQATLAALDTLKVQAQAQGGALLQLGTAADGAHRGLFALIDTANVKSALDAQVSALDLVNVALQVANSHHLADLQVPVPGVSAWATLIEPPSIAIGGVGATAYTAQLRVRLAISTSAIPALGPLLQALGTSVNLPVVLDVTNGKGTLTRLCDASAQGRTATIATQASLLNLCVGKFDDKAIASTSQSCDVGLRNENLVTVLGVPLITNQLHLQALTGQGDLTLHPGETGSIHMDLDLGDAVADLANGLLSLILGTATSGNAGSPNVAQMADDLWNNAGPYPDTPNGRKQRMQYIQQELAKPVSPQTTALLPGLANLVGGLLGSVGDLLGGVLGAVTGDQCTTTLLGLPGGSADGCKAILRDTLGHIQAAGSGTALSNALLAPLAQVLDLLRPVLNDVGQQFLQPLLATLLGEEPGRTDVHLQSLQCHRVQLVY
ncbi:TadG family pilus assembly protein [Fulvimonas soli]|uniref:Putative Tad-like protein involved in Flp pilus assembly n=1 Tax=Fulvimonas soli TaxID=155197 RepID=A0A316HWM2_9GAMM|nr:TadG family pilus assembly protein [Fulvimonas soli]PWK85856.1 putative Tad-like protein involved in Flp pilus assembly [Fulvimonas soli]TNY27240.1 hypothetical protein BV497_04465 [Fulvimonas soli]